MHDSSKPKYKIVDLLCVHCGATLLWDEMPLDNGTVMRYLHWQCPRCGKLGFNICSKE